jgi:hypothetical protein
MRTHRSVIRIQDDTPSWDKRGATARNKQFGRFADTCKSLARDGFDYTVELARNGACLTLTVTGTAGADAKVTRKPARKAFHLSAKVTPEKCAKMAAEARKAAIGGDLEFGRPYGRPYFDRRAVELNKRAGKLIARAKARGESVIEDSSLFGFAFRQSVATLIAERKQKQPYYSGEAPARADRLEARLLALAEYKYWRELELLSGQRDHFRPGVADTLDSSDELEVAA